jgi:hypothetical protein
LSHAAGELLTRKARIQCGVPAARLVLGEHDLVMTAGEAAEFGTRVPHWFGNAGPDSVEFLSLFGPQGERMHVRVRPARKPGNASASS